MAKRAADEKILKGTEPWKNKTLQFLLFFSNLKYVLKKLSHVSIILFESLQKNDRTGLCCLCQEVHSFKVKAQYVLVNNTFL